MRKLQRVLFGLSLLLVLASWATCHLGMEHEIDKIPIEQRAHMEDFDWVGIQWITRGTIIFMAGALAAITAFVHYMIRRSRPAAKDHPKNVGQAGGLSRMKMIPIAVVLLFGFLITSSGFAQTTQCNYRATPCEAYAGADAVFIGTVTKIVPETIEIWQRDKDYDQTANVTVEKAYKGVRGNSIVLHQLGRHNAPKFITGVRYLFYADFDRVTKTWEVKPCGSTHMAKYVQGDLRYLEGLPASVKRTRIAGEIVRYESDRENPQGTTERIPGMKVKIIGEGKEYEAITDANGVYEAYDLPSGKYVIQPTIPDGLVLMGVMHYGTIDRSKFQSLEIELKEGSCSGATIMLTEAGSSILATGFTSHDRAHRDIHRCQPVDETSVIMDR